MDSTRLFNKIAKLSPDQRRSVEDFVDFLLTQQRQADADRVPEGALPDIDREKADLRRRYGF